MTSLSAMVLAAGQGTRMQSTLAKPAHRLCGRPMVSFGLDALAEVDCERVVVVIGHGADRVRTSVGQYAPANLTVNFVVQEEQLGTGDAVAVGLQGFAPSELDEDDADIIVMPGDTPLIRPSTIAALVDHHRAERAGATLLTARLEDPSGYGRVVRGRDGKVLRIVEHKDADSEERAIDEINTSIYCFRRSVLSPALRRVVPANAQGEYYLTDAVEVLRDAGYPIAALIADDAQETIGVNDRGQLAEAEAVLRQRTNEYWLRHGVTIVDPLHTYIDVTVDFGTDVTIFPGSVLQGDTRVGDGSVVGPGCHLIDTDLGRDVRLDQTTSRGAQVGDGATVGPYAVLEQGTKIPANMVTGPLYAAP
jgi:bifunctional UDP-N-acetylglucosamine pyrophosphorylase/glucosamine-1-phosphate N-acetyltransferase